MSQKAELAKHLCQTRLGCFAQMAFSWVFPGQAYLPHWSLDRIAEALSRCHRGETRRLIINLPPRYLKSFYASVVFPAWTLARCPEEKIMCITGTRGLVEEQHRMSLQLMRHPSYREVFPHLRRVEEANQVIRTPHGGQRSGHLLTPGSGITGLGADTIIIDDPLPAGYSDDLKRIEQVNRWYDQNVYQRLNDKAKGVIIVVMQRLNVEDLSGHLLKQEGWEVLSLPAVATQDEERDGRLVRRWGEALNPKIESIEELKEAMHAMGAKAFQAQYQQDPYSPGEGEGSSGAHHWLTPVGPEMPGVGEWQIVFMRRSQEEILDEELFLAPHRPASNDPPLRPMTMEEQVRHAQSLRRSSAEGVKSN